MFYGAVQKGFVCMKAMRSTSKEIYYLSLVSGITVAFALFALAIRFGSGIYDFLDLYAKTINLEFYLNLIFLYLAAVLWFIYRGWRRALAKQKELENIILSINPDVLMVVDGQDQIILCNNFIERMLQYTSDEVVGRKTDDFIVDLYETPETGQGFYERIVQDGFYIGEVAGKKKDGDLVPLEMIVGNLEGENGKVLLLRDITARKQAEAEVKKLNDELEMRVKERTAELQKALEEIKVLDQLKDSFLSSVSHELRTPLTSIRSFSEILLQYDQENPETLKEFAEIINSESERLTRLINEILDLTRIQAGGMVWEDSLVSMEEVIRDVVKVQYQLLQEKSLRLTVDISPDLPLVFADRDRMQQVITNLLGNAIKFSFEGKEIRICGETLPGEPPDETSEWIRIRVSDQGIGIEEKDYDNIFDKFCQISSDALKDKPRGTGLGLPICKEIITHYGGEIRVESEPGKGSTFFFTLPAATVSSDRTPHSDLLPRKP
jgi:PAS domain S-box-containing protein